MTSRTFFHLFLVLFLITAAISAYIHLRDRFPDNTVVIPIAQS